MVQYLHFRILKLNLKFPLISWLQLLCSLSLSLSLQQTPAVRKRLSNSTALRCEHLVSNSSGKHVRQETRVEWSVLYIEKTLQICEILSSWAAEWLSVALFSKSRVSSHEFVFGPCLSVYPQPHHKKAQLAAAFVQSESGSESELV